MCQNHYYRVSTEKKGRSGLGLARRIERTLHILSGCADDDVAAWPMRKGMVKTLMVISGQFQKINPCLSG